MQIEELNQLAMKIAKIKDQKDQLNKQLQELEKELEPLQEKFNEILVQENKPNWFVDGYGLFSPKVSKWWKVLDYAQLRPKLKEKGLEDLLTINSQALRGWLNAMDSVSEYDGIVEPYTKLSVSYKRS